MVDHRPMDGAEKERGEGAGSLRLLALRQEELARLLEGPARARALARHFYESPRAPRALPEKIEGLSGRRWREVRGALSYSLPRTLAAARGSDGTVRLSLELQDGAPIETVLIPGRGRSTVCISSQSGCTRRCAFCATARLGFRRQLTADELMAQWLLARELAPPEAPLRNVVFMGMGEPMDNLDEVLLAVELLTQRPAPQLAAGHITVSTSGVLPGMRRFFERCRANLALSLNGTVDAVRARLMPQTEQWPIAELLALLREAEQRDPNRISFIEYVLFGDVNDSEEDAERLCALLEGMRARVNLIPHNRVDGCALLPPEEERMRRFRQIVHGAGIRCLLRLPRGPEVDAACGQLALRSR